MRKISIPDNLTSLTYQHIKDYILEGRLENGERLTEEFVSKKLGVSKSPVREALNRLETEGLIRIEPRRGAYIRSFTPDEVHDLYDYREALETHAVSKAKVTRELIGELKSSLTRQRQHLETNNKRRYIEEDIHFHALIAAAADNSRLSEALETLQNQSRLLRLKTYNLSRSQAVQAHTRIIEALENENRAQARRLMKDHIQDTCRKLMQHMEQQTHSTSAA